MRLFRAHRSEGRGQRTALLAPATGAVRASRAAFTICAALVLVGSARVSAQPAGGAAAEAPAGAVAEGSAPADATLGAPSVPADRSAEVTITAVFPEGVETRLGQPLPVSLNITLPADLALAAINVRGNRFVEIASDDGAEVVAGSVTRTLSLVVFRSGTFTATGFEVVLIDGDGVQHRVVSDPFVVDVSSTIVNESNPAPAPSDPPLVVLTRDMRPLYVGVGAGCIMLGFLFALGWRRLRTEDADEVVDLGPITPAWQIALDSLDSLEAEGLLDAGQALEFHMRLSEILRIYIGARFQFLALEMTTTEIRAHLNRVKEAAGEYREEIVEVLGDMDLVKFAKFIPDRSMSEECLDSSRRLVMDLSARERDTGLASEAPADAGPIGGDTGDDDPHAPSPESTTELFTAADSAVTGVAAAALDSSDGAPSNIVALEFPRPAAPAPESAESAPAESAPTESDPAESAPTESAPTESAPTESAPTESAPTESAPTEEGS